MRESKPPVESPNPDEYPDVDLSNACALVIDDDAAARARAREALRETGYFTRFHEAQNGLEGFKLLANHVEDVDLVLCDLEMPEFDGFKFLQMQSARRDFAAVPVIVITSRGEAENRVRGLELGAADYLVKPFVASELRLRARHQLYIRRLEDALRTAVRQLAHISKTDALTGLPNRRHFVDALEREFARAARYNHRLGVLILDIDNFKRVNDTHGHLVGDQVLKGVGRVLGYRLRSADLAARFGGEEFAVLLPETDLEGARLVAERYRREIAQQETMNEGGPLHVTVSIGVASYPETAAASLTELLRRADAALYTAKESGKNRVEVAL